MKLPIGTTKNNEKKKARAEEKAAHRLYTDEIMPIVAMDEALGAGVMEDGRLCDCFQVVSKDLNSISKDQLLRDQLTWDKLYKTYPGDLKEVFFSYHTETEEQQRYLEHKLATTDNPINRRFLELKLKELYRVHDLYLTPGSALFFYAKNPTEYRNSYITIYTTLTRTSQPLVRKMSLDKKQQLFYRLCNKNLKK